MSDLEKENERQYRVLNQMISMHAALRDRYQRWSLVLSVGLLAGAICLNAFVFAGDAVFTAIGVDATAARAFIGAISVVLLIISLVELKTDWAGSCREHGNAVKTLSDLKASYRMAHSRPNDPGASALADLSAEYGCVMDGLPPIPERLHNRLKARHLFKLEESRWISAHPRTPLVIGRWILRWHGTREAISDAAKI